jgi:hypothetical protein
MATPRLSKEAEIKITDSLSEVAELVNSGTNPNEAIAKTASANGIPVGHLELMVRAYNTGRSEAQRQSGGDPMEKLAEFELADLNTVIGLVYPDNVKTASANLRNILVSDTYKRAPEQPKPELKPLAKLASDNSKYVPMPKDTLGHTRALSSMIEKIGRNSEKMRMDSAISKDRLMEGISKLASYFRTFGGVPFVVAKDNSVRLFGKKAEALLNILSSSNKSLKKQAGTLSDIIAPVEITDKPYSLIHECIKHAELHLNKQASSDFLKKAVNSSIASGFSQSLPSEKTGSVLDGVTKCADVGGSSGSSNKIDKMLTEEISGFRKETMKPNLTKATSALLKGPGGDAPNSVKDYEFSNDQLVQDMMLKNIRASAAISDLMANDEIIGAHHPEDVAFHFNEISNIAPESSTNVSVMRPLLRKRLEGGGAAIDPTDVQQMLDIEKVKAETRRNKSQNDTLLRGITGR